MAILLLKPKGIMLIHDYFVKHTLLGTVRMDEKEDGMPLINVRNDGHAIRELLLLGATSISQVLTAETLIRCRIEAKRLAWRKAPERFGSRDVAQDFSVVEEFAHRSIFHQLRGSIEAYLDELLLRRDRPLLSAPLRFNDMRLQRYEPGSSGIEPHRDGNSNYGLVALVVLEGGGKFCICDDHERTNTRHIPHYSGDIVLLSGTALGGENHQPCHFLEAILSPRMTLGLRCKVA